MNEHEEFDSRYDLLPEDFWDAGDDGGEEEAPEQPTQPEQPRRRRKPEQPAQPKQQKIPSGNVLFNALEQRQRKAARQRVEFKWIYGKMNHVHFRNKEALNMDGFRGLPKKIVWCEFSNADPKAVLAVYPVMCRYADYNEDTSFQISQQNIATLAGVSVRAVRDAIAELESLELVSKRKVTEGVRHFYVYNVQFVRGPMLDTYKGDVIYFHNCIIDSGIWARLKPTARVFYLAARARGRQDMFLYEEVELEGWDHNEDGHAEYMRERKWDVVPCSATALCEDAGINPSCLRGVWEELRTWGLMDQVGGHIRVYLKPSIFPTWPEGVE